MSDVLKVLLEQAGGPAGLIVLALSVATNIVQAIRQAKLDKQAEQVRAAAGAIIRGVEAYAPQPQAPVKREVQAEAILSGVINLVQSMVDAETKPGKSGG